MQLQKEKIAFNKMTERSLEKCITNGFVDFLRFHTLIKFLSLKGTKTHIGS